MALLHNFNSNAPDAGGNIYMETIMTFMETTLRRFLITCMMLLTVAVFWQVASRYILANPASWTDEAARYALTWVAMLGGVYVYGLRQHLAVTILPERWANTGRGVFLSVIGHLVAFTLGLVSLIGGSIMTYGNFENNQVSAVLHINMGYVYASVPMAGLLFMVYAVRFIGQDFQRWQSLKKV